MGDSGSARVHGRAPVCQGKSHRPDQQQSHLQVLHVRLGLIYVLHIGMRFSNACSGFANC